MDEIHHKVGRWPGWDLNLGLRAKCFFLSIDPPVLLLLPHVIRHLYIEEVGLEVYFHFSSPLDTRGHP